MTATEINLEYIGVHRLAPSALRTQRKSYDEAALAELTVSIGEKGVLEPLLVRPDAAPGQYEIVFGHRRWRAARNAGLETVPCMVREIDDLDAMEMQLAENIQREDLSPIEEARQYRALLDYEIEGKHPHTIETLAAKLGRTSRLIERKLTLLGLTGEAAEAIETKKLPWTVGMVIASVPGEAARAEAAKLILHPQFQEQPLSYVQAQELIESKFKRSLHGVYFDLDDETYEGAPACRKCPKLVTTRGGSTCTDVECFARKEAAEYARWAAAQSGKGVRVLPMAESVRLAEDPARWDSRYVVAKDFPDDDLIHPEAVKLNTLRWENLVAGQEPELVIFRNEQGKAVRLYDRELAKAAARNNGHKLFREDYRAEQKSHVTKPEAERKDEVLAEQKAREEKRELNESIAKEIYGLLREKMTAIGSLTTKQYRAVMLNLVKQTDLVDDVLERRGHEGRDEKKLHIDKMSEIELDHLLVDLALGPLIDWSGDLLVGEMEPLLNAFGLNSKTVIKAVKQEREKRAKKKPKISKLEVSKP